MIYLDYCATTPMSERSLEVFTKASKNFFGNPSSLHDEGSKANSLLEQSRTAIANCINGEASGVYFTGGGSDSNNLAIKSLVKGKKGHIITTSIEHFSVLNTFLQLEEEGFDVTFLDVDREGLVSISKLKDEIKENTILVSIGHANSDIGTIQSIAEIGLFLKQHNILFHSDCVQSFGKIPVDVKALNLDSISLSSHKIYGPKGVGAVYISPHVNWKPIIPNTSHEKGFRAGTVNVPAIASFAEAAIEIVKYQDHEAIRLKKLSQLLLQRLSGKNISYSLVGHSSNRLAHHLSLQIHGIEGQWVMLQLNQKNIAISTGTACKVGEQNASKTMLQLGYIKEAATELIRISMGKQTTEEHIERTAAAIEATVKEFFQ
ncbi:aminotransferase class V-fold PLP-dependent enzyme [Anaerobacillus alkaliphilus]|uniref:Aminotransferase class V-fold PLP-dependent enzyme n=1 Tax=Anaerobacillus alkaliphilus TaxID=1548597 RepID=A0A4Q0VT22_9BACI|nr:IscS subfamily cysteine desulfurase [Anaerobacillus alkaliphilus]RXI99914.1 aminotransferase class V-fold PLP-dependent enzyme [Anaerobacillus alkaliphilus]